LSVDFSLAKVATVVGAKDLKGNLRKAVFCGECIDLRLFEFFVLKSSDSLLDLDVLASNSVVRDLVLLVDHRRGNNVSRLLAKLEALLLQDGKRLLHKAEHVRYTEALELLGNDSCRAESSLSSNLRFLTRSVCDGLDIQLEGFLNMLDRGVLEKDVISSLSDFNSRLALAVVSVDDLIVDPGHNRLS